MIQRRETSGRYKWVVWGILSLIYFIVMFHRMSVGAVRPELTRAFGLSAASFANIGSVYFYAYMLMQIPTGILADTLGPKMTVTSGTAISAAGSVLFGFSDGYYTALAGRFLVGIGVSVVFISVIKIISVWFSEKEFATLTGFTAFIGNIGGIMAQAPLVIMVSILTWRYTFVSLGVFSFLLALVCFFFVKDRPGKALPDMPHYGGRKAGEAIINSLKALQDVVKNPMTWPPVLYNMASYGAFHSLTGAWGAEYLINMYGIGKISAANFISLTVLGTAISSVLAGYISDRLSNRKGVMLIVGGLAVICWSAFIFAGIPGSNPGLLGIILFTVGIFSGGSYISYSLIREVNNPGYPGISTAFHNFGCFAGAAIVPVIMGKVIDMAGSVPDAGQAFHKAFLCCIASISIGYVSLLFTRETRGRNIYGDIKNLTQLQFRIRRSI